ncbi:hypothetical protein AVEN_177552-1 [Araneus ventricosus]|uniref:Uncharacterized protein n=1 Tax=Araneus ventricosus TaxID=182803 RepID=A0A4Y2PXG9_ARAVE|nr:hypothetical protein AVEN_177552-1 [Araneus ventricosus]
MHASASLRDSRENAPIESPQSGEESTVWPPQLLQHIVYNSDAVDLQVATAGTRSCGRRLTKNVIGKKWDQMDEKTRSNVVTKAGLRRLGSLEGRRGSEIASEMSAIGGSIILANPSPFLTALREGYSRGWGK